MNKWNPSEEQQLGSITRTFEFFVEELTDLQDELDCPDVFIYDFLEVIRNQWSPDSCHSTIRKHKKDNTGMY